MNNVLKPNLTIALSGILIGGTLVMTAAVSARHLSDLIFARLMLVGFGAWALGFAWGSLVVRCPACKSKLFWQAVTKRSVGQWLVWLRRLERCPSCRASLLHP